MAVAAKRQPEVAIHMAGLIKDSNSPCGDKNDRRKRLLKKEKIVENGDNDDRKRTKKEEEGEEGG